MDGSIPLEARYDGRVVPLRNSDNVKLRKAENYPLQRMSHLHVILELMFIRSENILHPNYVTADSVTVEAGVRAHRRPLASDVNLWSATILARKGDGIRRPRSMMTK